MDGQTFEEFGRADRRKWRHPAKLTQKSYLARAEPKTTFLQGKPLPFKPLQSISEHPPSGLGRTHDGLKPRALPWAGLSRAVGASEEALVFGARVARAGGGGG